MAPRIPARCWQPMHLAPRLTAPCTALAPRGARPSLALQPAAPTLLPPQQTRGVKYGWPTLDRKHDPKRVAHAQRYNAGARLPALAAAPAAARARKAHSTPLRTGLLAVKRGMTGYYTRGGRRLPCTVLQTDQCQVVAHKRLAAHGYSAVQVGCGARRADAVAAPLLGYYEARGVPPKERLVEFRVRGDAGLAPPVGAVLMPDWFHKGQWVDVRSHSRGMGFEGGMKRHNFSGQGASHGNSKNHRTMGSAGASQGSGSRVLPNKKMPGNMGNERVTVQNLAVLRVDNELGIIVVKGAVGGPKGRVVMVSDAIKKPPPPKEFIDKMNRVMNERFPNAAADLEKSRLLHMKLKMLRQEGRIEEALKKDLREGEGILA